MWYITIPPAIRPGIDPAEKLSDATRRRISDALLDECPICFQDWAHHSRIRMDCPHCRTVRTVKWVEDLARLAAVDVKHTGPRPFRMALHHVDHITTED